MANTTPFFKCLGPLLFGKPPTSQAKAACAKFSQAHSFSHLRKVFDTYIPSKLLSPSKYTITTRCRIFSLDVIFWSFLHQIQTPEASCREAVRSVSSALTRRSEGAKSSSISQATSAYCQARKNCPSTCSIKSTHISLIECKSISQREKCGMGGKSD
jgi:hypothetical protein